MRLLSLPAILRAAGLTVHEVSGWRSRGAGNFGPVRGITCHHTAGSRSSTDAGEIRTLIHGSSSAPAPIAQLYLSRTGDWHVVASGVCWHNLTGWGGPNKGLGNYHLVGIEAQHSGGTEPWTDRQYRSYVRGVAALCKGLGVPVDRVAGHKEHQPGAKNDPSFDMRKFRADVRDTLEGDNDMLDAKDIPLIQKAVHNTKIGRTEATFGTAMHTARTGILAALKQHEATAAALVAQDAKLDLILAKLDDSSDVEAKVDALAKAEEERAAAEEARDAVLLAAVTDLDDDAAGQTAA